MPKGVPWTREEEKQLKDLVKVKAPIDVIAGKLSRKPDAVMIKCKRLKLEVVVARGYTTTTSIVMPKELPSVEEEKYLRSLLESQKHVNVIAEALGKTVDGVKSKMRRLGLKEVDTVKKIIVSSSSDLEVEVDKQQTTGSRLSTTNFELPEDLPSVEEALKLFAAILGLSGTVLGIFVSPCANSQ